MENTAIIDELKLENDALKTENATLRSELAEVNSKLSWLMEQLSANRRKIFGASSEKSEYDQVGLFGDDTVEVQVIDGPVAEKQQGRPKKRGELGSRLPADIPVEIIECVLPENERDCPEGHGPMRTIGKELVRRELKIIPAKAVVKEFWRYSYLCAICEQTSADPAPIVKAALPPQLIKGSMCSPETAAHIIVQKCVMGSPLYRQEAEWNRNGIQIKRQTMASWCIEVSEKYLEPLYDELHRLLCQHRFLHSDGTDFQVLKEPGKSPQSKSCMWVYRTSGDAKHPIILYDYQPDKAQERPRDFLQGFIGYLMTDAAPSYHGLPDEIILVGCLAHVRRKFVDALNAIDKPEDRVGSLALAGRLYCDKLFEIEAKIRDKSFDERYTIRIEESSPIFKEFHKWLLSVQPSVAQKSAFGKAVNYSINQWKYLERVLEDGCIEISNNRCERSVKPFVINRKNFLFSDTVPGARAAAVLHSVTETAKENGLNPFEYLAHIFRTSAGVNLRENPDMVVALLPENALQECRVIKS